MNGLASSERDDRADRLALVHEIECVVDALQRQYVGDQLVDPYLALHVPVDDARNVGAPPRTAECSPLPYPARDELERARANFLSRAGDADDHRYAPPAMTAF